MWTWVRLFLLVTGWCLLGITWVCVKLNLLECFISLVSGLNERSFSQKVPTDGFSPSCGSNVIALMPCFLKNSVSMFFMFCCSSVAMEGEVSHVTQTHPFSAYLRSMSNSSRKNLSTRAFLNASTSFSVHWDQSCFILTTTFLRRSSGGPSSLHGQLLMKSQSRVVSLNVDSS